MLRASAARMFGMRSLAILSIGAFLACGGASEAPQPGGETRETTGPGTTGPERTNQESSKVRAKIAAASLGDGSANVQLAFVSEATAPATVVVIKVDLVDQRDGTTVDTLQASAPSVWNGSTYESWNETVTPGGDLRASYELTAPNWSTIDGNGTRTTGSSSYSISYKLRMTLSIDGALVTIESDNLQREPQVAT